MAGLISKQIPCPYCGEHFEALIDSSEGDSQYTEDCYICCQPIVFRCTVIDDEEVLVETLREDDAY